MNTIINENEKEVPIIINCASQEYSKAMKLKEIKKQNPKIIIKTCIFYVGERKGIYIFIINLFIYFIY